MKEKLLWGVFVVICACAIAATVALFLRGRYARVPDFALVERSGKPIGRQDLIGHAWVADFVFTRCQATCPAMTSLMYGLRERFPNVRFVSFTADPQYDTPEVLAKFAETNRLSKEGWFWITGPPGAMQDLATTGFHLAAQQGRKEEVVHSNRFVLVDRYGRIRGDYPVVDNQTLARCEEELARLEEDLKKVLAERPVPVKKLPAFNAGLNAAGALLLVTGLFFVKTKRIAAHRLCMLAALGVSTLFLVSYLTAHYYVGSTRFPGQGWVRPVYFTILVSHTILAAGVAPLALITVYQAFREQFNRHRALARWTFPIWLYVSISGVVVYVMLYRT